MTDKELLELAAKAAEIVKSKHEEFIVPAIDENDQSYLRLWNPLTDDGDALRLAVKLEINIDFVDYSAWRRTTARLIQKYWGVEFDPSYRRAIVCVAAEIGKEMT